MSYDLTGKTYNRLTVIERASPPKKGAEIQWRCLCICGEITVVRSYLLRTGHTKSCGCLQRESRKYPWNQTHGMHDTPTYHTWEGMIQRCCNPDATRYPAYGAVGVSVCSEWLSFPRFLLDMGERPKDHTLDRINPYGNYEKENCRWATRKIQANNTRKKYILEEVSPLC